MTDPDAIATPSRDPGATRVDAGAITKLGNQNRLIIAIPCAKTSGKGTPTKPVFQKPQAVQEREMAMGLFRPFSYCS
jgi:hypothetical protein